tara:strand:+ start:36746 stop:37303 length:558 start_codon:yes stop_codon:yes gene_type:complete
MKLSIQLDGVPIVATERYEVGALAHEVARAVANGKPLSLSVETDDGELILQSAEQFLCGGLVGPTVRDEYGNAFPPNPMRMPLHAAAERRAEGLAKELAGLREAHATERTRLEGKIVEMQRARDKFEKQRDDETRNASTMYGVAGAAIECTVKLESMLAGSGSRWPKGLRRALKEVRETHEGWEL